jgi:hypothetical protein
VGVPSRDAFGFAGVFVVSLLVWWAFSELVWWGFGELAAVAWAWLAP